MRISRLLPVIGVTALSVGVIASPAPAAPADPLAAQAAAADDRGYIIVHEKDGIEGRDGSVFFPTGEIAADTIVVIAEPGGKLPAGVTVEKIEDFVAARRSADSGQAGGGSGGSLTSNFTYAYTASSASMSSPFTGDGVWG